jgi:hypothetical protein
VIRPRAGTVGMRLWSWPFGDLSRDKHPTYFRGQSACHSRKPFSQSLDLTAGDTRDATRLFIPVVRIRHPARPADEDAPPADSNYLARQRAMFRRRRFEQGESRDRMPMASAPRNRWSSPPPSRRRRRDRITSPAQPARPLPQAFSSTSGLCAADIGVSCPRPSNAGKPEAEFERVRSTSAVDGTHLH